jgi:uracil phosphoribosyltransferase
LVQHHLARLRSVDTPPAEFLQLVRRLAALLAYEATSNLPTAPWRVRTPLCEMTAAQLHQRVALVPILRAGLGMVDPILDLLPDAEVWHLGVYRDEATATPVEYYSKLPRSQPVDVALVLDPMLATGGSATAALQGLSAWGVPRLKLVSILATPPGIAAVHAAFPAVEIYVAAIDPALNDQKFIVPGLGDAGDRSFNTLRPHD